MDHKPHTVPNSQLHDICNPDTDHNTHTHFIGILIANRLSNFNPHVIANPKPHTSHPLSFAIRFPIQFRIQFPLSVTVTNAIIDRVINAEPNLLPEPHRNPDSQQFVDGYHNPFLISVCHCI